MRGPEKYFHLPYPPTANTLFANGSKGRYRTANYNAWLVEAGLRLNAHQIAPFAFGVWLDIHVHRPDKRRRDLDNLCKPLFDLLVKHQTIRDDSLICGYSIKWIGQGNVVWIRIRNTTRREMLDAGIGK